MKKNNQQRDFIVSSKFRRCNSIICKIYLILIVPSPQWRLATTIAKFSLFLAVLIRVSCAFSNIFHLGQLSSPWNSILFYIPFNNKCISWYFAFLKICLLLTMVISSCSWPHWFSIGSFVICSVQGIYTTKQPHFKGFCFSLWIQFQGPCFHTID